MAELLIYNRIYEPSDPLKAMSGYRPGDVVAVMPDGHVWGAAEVAPVFFTMRVPGPVSDWQYLLEVAIDPLGLVDGIQARRKQRIALETLPSTVRRSLVDTGRVEITSRPVIETALVSDRQVRVLAVADR